MLTFTCYLPDGTPATAHVHGCCVVRVTTPDGVTHDDPRTLGHVQSSLDVALRLLTLTY